MAKYRVDSNALIQAKNSVLGFEVNPGFWEWLEEQCGAGNIKSTWLVYEELVSRSTKDDVLRQWAKKMEKLGFFDIPDADITAKFQEIADYAVSKCDQAERKVFLNGADPWLIAHAKAEKSVVVTEEKRVGALSKQIKIPNVCVRFGVDYINTSDLLKREGVTFVRETKNGKG